MSQRRASLAEELRIIRAARRNGRRLGIEPLLTDSQPTRAREQYLASVLSPNNAGES